MKPDHHLANGSVGVFHMHDEDWVRLSDYEAAATPAQSSGPTEYDEPTHKNHPGHHDGHTCEAMGQMLADFGSQRTTPEQVVARLQSSGQSMEADLAMLVVRLTSQLEKDSQVTDLAQQAIDFLKRKVLQGSPILASQPPAPQASAQPAAAWSVSHNGKSAQADTLTGVMTFARKLRTEDEQVAAALNLSKAIEAELADHHTEQVMALPFAILDDEITALRRFHECAEDGEGYDVADDMMKRLAEIGLLHRPKVGRTYYMETDFGLSVLNGDFALAATMPSHPTVPEGWKLVPIEPSEKMINAAEAECYRMAGCLDPVMHIWDVMLAATPSPLGDAT